MLDLLSAKTCNSYSTYSLINKAKSTALSYLLTLHAFALEGDIKSTLLLQVIHCLEHRTNVMWGHIFILLLFLIFPKGSSIVNTIPY
jgi:hypothetical protein